MDAIAELADFTLEEDRAMESDSNKPRISVPKGKNGYLSSEPSRSKIWITFKIVAALTRYYLTNEL